MKKNILKMINISIILFFNALNAKVNAENYIEFFEHEVFIPQRLGAIKLCKDINGFHVIKNDEIYDIQNCFCDPILKKLSNRKLMRFLGRNNPKTIEINPELLDQINEEGFVEIIGEEKDKILSQLFGNCGYIVVNQMSDGEYRLEVKMRLLGGGWGSFFRVIAYVAVGAAAVGAIGVVAGGLSGAAVGWTVTKIAIAAGAKVTITAGTGLVYGAVGGSGILGGLGAVGGGILGAIEGLADEGLIERQAPVHQAPVNLEPMQQRQAEQRPAADQEPVQQRRAERVQRNPVPMPQYHDPFLNTQE